MRHHCRGRVTGSLIFTFRMATVHNCACMVVSSVRRNKKLPCANFRKSWQDAIYGGVSKPLTGSGRVSPMCAVHTSFLLTLLTMSNTMGFAKKQVFSKTAVPIFFNQNSLALSQRSLSQSLDAEAKPSWAGQRTTHASSKQVFVNYTTGVSLSLIWITTLNTYVICQT